MNKLPNHQQTGGENSATGDAEDLIKALDALESGEQQQKSALFAQAYPGIVRAIARKVSQKDILAALSRGGLKLHPTRFREMLEFEQKLRDDRGERTCCTACGSVLQPLWIDKSPMVPDSSNQIGQSGVAADSID